jgi:hypothetical protein
MRLHFSCHSGQFVLDSFGEYFWLHDRRDVLLSSDVLCADAFWREEVVGLE